MEIIINNSSFSFIYRGFGPQYTYETIAGEAFTGLTTRSVHLLMYSTLLFCNPDKFSLTFTDFDEWLYEHPAEEQQMNEAITAEFLRRNAMIADKKKE